MTTGAMRRVQKEMLVLTVMAISTRVPVSAVLPTIVITMSVLTVRASMRRKMADVHRRLIAATVPIVRASAETTTMATVRSARMATAIARASITTRRVVNSVRNVRMATMTVPSVRGSIRMPREVTVRSVRASTPITNGVDTDSVRTMQAVTARSVRGSIRMPKREDVRSVRVSMPTAAEEVTSAVTVTDVRNVRVRPTIIRMPNTARRNR